MYAMLNLMYHQKKAEKMQPASIGIMVRPSSAVTLI